MIDRVLPWAVFALDVVTVALSAATVRSASAADGLMGVIERRAGDRDLEVTA